MAVTDDSNALVVRHRQQTRVHIETRRRMKMNTDNNTTYPQSETSPNTAGTSADETARARRRVRTVSFSIAAVALGVAGWIITWMVLAGPQPDLREQVRDIAGQAQAE